MVFDVRGRDVLGRHAHEDPLIAVRIGHRRHDLRDQREIAGMADTAGPADSDLAEIVAQPRGALAAGGADRRVQEHLGQLVGQHAHVADFGGGADDAGKLGGGDRDRRAERGHPGDLGLDILGQQLPVRARFRDFPENVIDFVNQAGIFQDLFVPHHCIGLGFGMQVLKDDRVGLHRLQMLVRKHLHRRLGYRKVGLAQELRR